MQSTINLQPFLNDLFITEEQIQSIGEWFITTLVHSKHKGIISHVHNSFQKLCVSLLSSQSLSHLPEEWFDSLIDKLDDSKDQERLMMRKSIGIASAFVAILRAEREVLFGNNATSHSGGSVIGHSVPPMLSRLIEKCIHDATYGVTSKINEMNQEKSAIAQLQEVQSDTGSGRGKRFVNVALGSNDSSKLRSSTTNNNNNSIERMCVTSLNLLNAIFLDSVLSFMLKPYFSRVFEQVIIGFQLVQSWRIRNSCLIVFSSLINRIVAIGGSGSINSTPELDNPEYDETNADIESIGSDDVYNDGEEIIQSDVQNDEYSQENVSNGELFSSLYEFLLTELDRAIPTIESFDIHPSLYPLLLLLSHFSHKSVRRSNAMSDSDAEKKYEQLIQLVMQTSGARHAFNRIMGAKALASLLPVSGLGNTFDDPFLKSSVTKCLNNLRESFEASNPSSSSAASDTATDSSSSGRGTNLNKAHGCLLQLSYLFLRLTPLVDIPENIVKDIMYVCEAGALGESIYYGPCHVIRDSSLQLLQLLWKSKDKWKTTNDELKTEFAALCSQISYSIIKETIENNYFDNVSQHIGWARSYARSCNLFVDLLLWKYRTSHNQTWVEDWSLLRTLVSHPDPFIRMMIFKSLVSSMSILRKYKLSNKKSTSETGMLVTISNMLRESVVSFTLQEVSTLPSTTNKLHLPELKYRIKFLRYCFIDASITDDLPNNLFKAIETYAEVLGSSSPIARSEMVQLLGMQNAPNEYAELLEACSTPDECISVRFAAAKSLYLSHVLPLSIVKRKNTETGVTVHSSPIDIRAFRSWAVIFRLLQDEHSSVREMARIAIYSALQKSSNADINAQVHSSGSSETTVFVNSWKALAKRYGNHLDFATSTLRFVYPAYSTLNIDGDDNHKYGNDAVQSIMNYKSQLSHSMSANTDGIQDSATSTMMFLEDIANGYEERNVLSHNASRAFIRAWNTMLVPSLIAIHPTNEKKMSSLSTENNQYDIHEVLEVWLMKQAEEITHALDRVLEALRNISNEEHKSDTSGGVSRNSDVYNCFYCFLCFLSCLANIGAFSVASGRFSRNAKQIDSLLIEMKRLDFVSSLVDIVYHIRSQGNPSPTSEIITPSNILY